MYVLCGLYMFGVQRNKFIELKMNFSATFLIIVFHFSNLNIASSRSSDDLDDVLSTNNTNKAYFTAFKFYFLPHSSQSNNFAIDGIKAEHKICNPKDFVDSHWIELTDAADASEQCLNVTQAVFLRRFASNKIHIHNAFSATAVNVLKYFGHLMTSLELDFIDNGECSSDYIAKYDEILRNANENCQQSLTSITIGSNPCGLNMLDHFSGPFQKVETVKIDQPVMTIAVDNPRLNEIFPVVQKLTLNFKVINNARIIDCEINLLDELII